MAETMATAALLRLVTWLSPAFPIGAFAYSGGLEQAVRDGHVANADDLSAWLSTVIGHGSLWNEAVLFAEAYRSFDDPVALDEVMELAEALAGSAERHRETMLLGEAFLQGAQAWPHEVFAALGPAAAYPVAVGAVAGAHGTGLEPSLAAYMHAVLSNLVSVAIRCGVTGQQGGIAVLAELESPVVKAAAAAAASTLDDLGSATLVAEIAALRHETLGPRLFRS